MNQRKAGVVLSYVSEGIKVISGLLYTPIMLHLLGQSEYGLYQLFYSVVSYLGLLSLGFGGAYMRFYSKSKAENDQSGVAKLNGMFMLIFSVISVICILCGLVMLSNVRAVFGTGLSEAEISKARCLMALMVFNLTLTFPDSVFNSYVTANERFFFQKILTVSQNILNPFLALPLLISGFGSVGLVCVTTILTVLRFGLDIWFCLCKLHMKFIFREFRISLLKEMWIFTFFIFLNQIIDRINWSVDKFLLGRFMGTSAVAIYGVGSQINTMYLEFSTAISNVFVPEVNRLVAENSENRNISILFTKVGRIQFMILVLVLTGFIFFGRPFIQLWAGEGYGTSYYVTVLLIAPVTVPLIQNLGIEIQRAKNMHKARSIVYLFIAIANVFISIPLIKRAGSEGAALGTAISLFAGNIIFMNWYYHKRIGLDMNYFWKEILKFIPSLIIPCIFGTLVMCFVTITGLAALACCIGLYLIIYCICMYLFGMNIDEKQMIMAPVKRLLKKSK